MDRFHSIRRYMLMSEGDWFSYFMDMSEPILSKNAADIKVVKLNRLLELSIRTSVSRNDIFRDDVRCDIKSNDLNKMMFRFCFSPALSSSFLKKTRKGATCVVLHRIMLHDIRESIIGGDFQPSTLANASSLFSGGSMSNNDDKLMALTGIDAFALDYKVEWPASIIFTGRNVIRYQLIFRLLFKLKVVESHLNKAWKEQMLLRELDLGNAHNESLMLRQKMLQFLESLLFYVFYEVIEPNWCRFMKNVREAKTVDSVLQANENFLRSTLEMCLLTNKKRVESLFKVLSTCEGYAMFVSRYTSDWKVFNFKNETTEMDDEKGKEKDWGTARRRKVLEVFLFSFFCLLL